jgi:hypothetical protein
MVASRGEAQGLLEFLLPVASLPRVHVEMADDVQKVESQHRKVLVVAVGLVVMAVVCQSGCGGAWVGRGVLRGGGMGEWLRRGCGLNLSA